LSEMQSGQEEMPQDMESEDSDMDNKI
jgi:hypothetical protein